MLASLKLIALPVCWAEGDSLALEAVFELELAVAVELVLVLELALEMAVADADADGLDDDPV